MSKPPKLKDSVYKRLILFPVALFYMAVLVLAAWPRQLSPDGRVMQAVQMAADHALARLAVLPAVNIFTGRTDGIRTATVRSCFKIVGYAKSHKPEVLYDSLPRCAERNRARTKDPYGWFHDKLLTTAIELLNTPGAKLDRNAPPLNVLFSIADYHCHHRPDAAFEHLVITSWHERWDLDTAVTSDRMTIEGAHRCRDGRWRPIRANSVPRGVDDK